MRLIKSLAFVFVGLLAFNAHAIDSIYNWNGLEFVRSGNAHHVHPASPQSTVLRGGWILDISDVEPKASASHAMPYKNNSNALVTVKPNIDPRKVSASAASKIKEAAKAAGPNPYLAVASIGCAVFCDALIDWGIDQLKKNDDGDLFVDVPDPNASVVTSDGYMWATVFGNFVFYSQVQACASLGGVPDGDLGCNVPSPYGNPYRSVWRQPSTCSNGKPVVNGVCQGTAPNVSQPLETYLQSNYTGKGWNHHWAKMTAEIVKNGGNVFTDGTSTSITGPAIVPVSTSETKTSVSLFPGTTTLAPAGHTGPTDSGTQTTTTTTTAKNTYSPAPLSPASSGGPATGPSMTTTQETKTTTSITNNVTNITNIVNETTTEKYEAPEENATDTPLTGIPELYKQKYPDGLTGVFNDFKSRINTTSFVQLIGALTPNISGAGTCPSWTIDLTWTPGGSMGTHTIGQDFCWIWPILKIIVIVTTLFTVRRLIFGG
ncbi:hypothetical protein [Comamonas jiangduensis]|uniref:hypothetical protein n=1 Tax=Comamonas jiangduensis TaxID=1194168 RepID=UPI0028AD90FA|nr:hypothetical protein [Comamonas jiangduensis]